MQAKRFWTANLLVLGLTTAAWAATAQADVIGATPNADFSNGSYTFSLAHNAASFTFSDTGIDGPTPPFNPFDPDPQGHYKAVAIQTGGAARFDSLFGQPSAFFTESGGPFIGPSLLGTYQSYPDATPIPFSNEDSFYALGLALDDGFHYGYARTADHRLLSYAYESTPGAGIAAGTPPSQAPATAVAEPASWGLFAFALALLGFGAARRSCGQRSLVNPNSA